MKNLRVEIAKIEKEIERLNKVHDAEEFLAKRMILTLKITRLQCKIDELNIKIEKRQKIVNKFAKIIGC